jgi:hypothetical protein
MLFMSVHFSTCAILCIWVLLINNQEDLFSLFEEIIQLRISKDELIAFIIMSKRSEAQTDKDHLHGLHIPPSFTL